MGKTSKKQKRFPRRAKQGVEKDKPNPFEIRVSKQHHAVLGRKKKADIGLPGISRNKAVKKREQTLLKEYQELHKSNSFVDRRIGENDATADLEERALARFAKEWRKSKKNNMFNLNDEDLTHMGKSLGEIDEFEDPKSNSEDEDGNLSSDFIKKAHFGGFMTMKNANLVQPDKSHKEIMQELISETKKQKYERQSEREANESLTEKLDEEWKNVRNLVSKLKQADVNLGKNEDSYDMAVTSLKFEIRGKPTDRLKTEDEQDREKKEKLERLEIERRKRMVGSTQDAGPKVSHISADSLDDGIALDIHEDDGKDDVVEKENINDLDNDDESEGDDDSDAESGHESEDSYKDIISEESDGNDSSMDEDDDAGKKAVTKSQSSVPKKVPTTLEELNVAFGESTSAEKIHILEKIIKKYHPSLGEGNREKMECLFSLLLKYLNSICRDPSSDFKLLDGLIPILYNLLQLSPASMSKSLLDILSQKRKIFLKQCRKKTGKKMPCLDTLILFKLIAIFYPTSDFHHPMVIAAQLFMSQILEVCHVTSIPDIFKGLFVCNMFLEYSSYAKRLVPEAIVFLKSVLSPHSNTSRTMSMTKLLLVTESSDLSGPLNLKCLVRGSEMQCSSSTSIQLLHSCIQILDEYGKLYLDIPSFEEIFSGVQESCQALLSQENCSALEPALKALKETLSKRNSNRTFLAKQKKPHTLKMYEPRLQAEFTGKKQRPVMSAKKAEKQKLLYKYKNELKGAVREIRRDNQFISRQKLNEQLEKDNDRKLKLKMLYQDLAEQEGEFKKYKKRRK